MNERSAHYLGESGKKYFADKFNERQNLGRRLQSRYFSPYCAPNLVLLDFGCGDGTISRQLPAAKKLGIEINPACHERIHELNKDLERPINVSDNITSVGDGSVDIVISNHCLEHVPHPHKALSEIKRVLVPGGKLVMVTPFDDWRQKGHKSWKPGDMQNHIYTWSPNKLGNLLVEAGFNVQEVRLCTSAWSPRIFWVHRFFGDRAFKLACHLLSRLIQRREVFSLAVKP